MTKMLHDFSIFNIKIADKKFTNLIIFFWMHANTTATTIQTKKIVLNEGKDN